MFSKTVEETDEEKIEDMVLTEFPYSLSPYTAYQLNMIIGGWLKEKKEEIKILDTFYIEKPQYCSGYIITHSAIQDKIALFNVANQPSIFCQHNSQYPTLDEALNAYLQKKVICAKLIIPVAQLKRNHFRLLVIEPEKKKAVFYDSKSMLVGMIAEVWASSSVNEYQYISKTCAKYFSLSWVRAEYQGHQAWNNHRDCGVYTVQYAFNEILNSSFTNDVDQLRGKHEELFEKQLLSEEKDHSKKETHSSSNAYKGMFYIDDTMQSPVIVDSEDEEDFEILPAKTLER